MLVGGSPSLYRRTCIEELEAASPLGTVIAVMRLYGLDRVELVAVKLPDGSFLRWEEGMTLSSEEKAVPVK